MGELVPLPGRRPRGCTVQRPDVQADVRADLLMIVSAARAVLDARNRVQRTLAIARLGAAVAAHDRGGIGA